MKVSIDWLDEWIPVRDLDPGQLADRLTMAGLEVDAIERPGHGHGDIVVGRIEAIEEHPDADRLVVCRVDVQESGHERTIVCGATNMESGDRVPVALPGSAPPGADFEIEAREVMGLQSEGMLASAAELDLAEESEGLMILDPDLQLGTPVFEALGLVDTVLEIDLTPNRADCLSHLGVAREVAALFDRPLREQRVDVVDEITGTDGAGPVGELADLTIEDPEGCPHYRMAILEDVEVSDSPAWLRHRLQSVGIRPVNSVVDVTNYVLMDVGQPLHAFDLDELAGPEIVVRGARDGESLVGIDHEEYELSTDDLVIADAERPVALAGVMGGAETEVGESTSRILIECAWFDPTRVRRSARRHGLHTDSSHRFERGVDPGGVDEALRRSVELFGRVQNQVADSSPTVRRGVESVGSSAETGPQIELDVDRPAGLLGIEIETEDCRDILEGLGVDVQDDGSTLSCRVPTWRRDLNRPVDLVEEIARIYGYDQIPTTLPEMAIGEAHRLRSEEVDETIPARETSRRLDWIRSALLDQGLREAINYSFMGKEDLDRLRLSEDDCRRNALEVANPLVASQAMMRTTLIPSLLENIETNLARDRRDVALFEIGRRYFEVGEMETVAMAVTGRRRRHWTGDRNWDFFDLKGVVEALATPWAIEGSRWQRPDVQEPYLHPGVQASWRDGDQILGVVGRLHPEVVRDQGFEQPVFVAEIDLEALAEAGPRRGVAEAPPKYPAVVRDYALVYDRDRPYAELRETVEQLAETDESFGAIFEGMELFDVYEGDQVPEGKRSLALEVTYRSSDKTLEESDIEEADRQLLSHLEESVGAELR